MSTQTIHQPVMVPIMNCVDCGTELELRISQYFRYRNGFPRQFYCCPNCQSTHGAHPDGRPMGVPGDEETRRARMLCHSAFDRWRRSGCMTREEAYIRLGNRLGMTRDECHFALFDAATCRKVLEVLGET